MVKMCTVKLYSADSDIVQTEEACLYFRYTKDVYVPYVWLECRFITDSPVTAPIKRVEFLYYGELIHRGLVDSIDSRREGGKYVVYLKSKGFTSLLCQNQPEPGMMTDIDLAGILNIFPEIPYVSGGSSTALNYLYIKDGSTVWDAICNFAFRQNNIYPYITETNTVMVGNKTAYTLYEIVGDERLVTTGTRYDFTKLVSDIHMRDINDNYNVYYSNNPEAVSREIVRHKQIPLDRQFLYEPSDAPRYKLNYSMRGMEYNYLRYIGYCTEDLLDKVSFRNFHEQCLHHVDVVFNGSEVITEIGYYDDGFFN